MKNITLFIYLLTIFLFISPLHAEDERYRVEVIVLTHLGHGEEAREVLAIENYSNSIDFLTPVPETWKPEEDEASEAGMSADQPAGNAEILADAGTAEEVSAAEDLESGAEKDPNEVVHLEEMSDNMADAWRRLRLSAPFRPLQYLSWEQGSADPFPLLRVHDLDLLLVDDPWEGVRLRLETDELIEAFSDETSWEPAPVSVLENEPDPGLAQEPQPPLEPTALELLPPPSFYYALDGTVSLVRKRFLHLYIDLQQRNIALPPAPVAPDGLSLMSGSLGDTGSASSDTFDSGDTNEPEEPSRFTVFDFRQNRQVKTARMEYFDGPVLSVLAYISPVLPAEDEN